MGVSITGPYALRDVVRSEHMHLLLAINPVIPGCGKGADENPSTFTQPTFSAPAL